MEENADGLPRYKDRLIDAAEAEAEAGVEETNTNLGAFRDLGKRRTDWQTDRTKKVGSFHRDLADLNMDRSRHCNDSAGLHQPANGYNEVRLSSSESSEYLWYVARHDCLELMGGKNGISLHSRLFVGPCQVEAVHVPQGKCLRL